MALHAFDRMSAGAMPLSDISCRLIAVKFIPPILVGAVFGPTRLRHDHAVGTAGLGDYSAALVDEGALARISADINAEIMAHRGIKGSAPCQYRKFATNSPSGTLSGLFP